MSTEDKPTEPVIEPTTAPLVEPVVEPKIEETVVEPTPPFWAKRKYIKRSFNFPFEGFDIQGNFFQREDSSIDVDGLCNNQEFESTQQLLQITALNQDKANALIEKIKDNLKYR